MGSALGHGYSIWWDRLLHAKLVCPGNPWAGYSSIVSELHVSVVSAVFACCGLGDSTSIFWERPHSWHGDSAMALGRCSSFSAAIGSGSCFQLMYRHHDASSLCFGHVS